MTTTKTTEQINADLMLRLKAQAMEIIKLRQENEELKKKEKKDTEESRNFTGRKDDIFSTDYFHDMGLDWAYDRPTDMDYCRIFLFEMDDYE